MDEAAWLLFREYGQRRENPFDKNSNLSKKIAADFGSYENWDKDFRATGAMRAIGWVVLYS